jgi:CheY-like chemotaxis protein
MTAADSETRGVDPIAYVKVLVWPLFLLAFLLIFKEPISQQFSRVSEVDLDLTAMKVAVALAAAESARGPARTDRVSSINSDRIITTADNSRSVQLNGAKVLWVDDNPDNNKYERQALSALGIEFVLAATTEDALKKIEAQKFGAIVSDFNRLEEPQGAYTLLAEVSKTVDHPPFIIYSGSSSTEFVTEAKSRGAFGETNQPTKLFELIIDALKTKT